MYKVYYYLPDWNEDYDGCDFACTCKDHHHKLQVPKIINIQKDIRELNPLPPSSQEYKEVLEAVTKGREAYEKTLTPVPNQLKNMGLKRMRPWLGSSKPEMMLSKVDLPQPEDPRSA